MPRYFEADDEWKMSRFLPAIAHGAVVVSESGGAPAEQAAWAGAVVFADGDALREAAAYYTTNATARAERAAAARGLLRSRRFAAALRGPAEALARASCPAWRAAEVGEPAGWQWEVGYT